MLMQRMQRTFIAIKPDAVQRELIGEIITKIERKGFKIIGMKMLHLTKEMAHAHYAEHIGKPFFDDLVRFITSGPIVAMVVQGVTVIEETRRIMGRTRPEESEQGSIRAEYAQSKRSNIIHGSDSYESAEREIALYFKEDELCTNWETTSEEFLRKY